MKAYNPSYNRSIVKLNLLKHQHYKNTNNSLKSFGLEELSSQLKQALNLIFSYSLKKKKILFIGFPYNKLVHNQVNHVFVTKIFFLKTSFKSKKICKRCDLCVVNLTSKNQETLLKEVRSLNIPVVIFGNTNTRSHESYIVQTDLKSGSIKNFWMFLLVSVLLKTK